MLMIGGGSTGKTSLAFKLACEEAAVGGTPLFICNQTKLEAKLPMTVQNASDGGSNKFAPEILARIQMKYVSSMNELKAVIAGLHAFVPSPSLVIIDDFSLIVDPLHSVQRSDPKFLEICLTLGAYVDDVLTFMATMRTAGSSANTSNSTSSAGMHRLELLITDSCEDASFLSVLQKTAPVLCKLVRAPEGRGDSVSLVLHQGSLFARQQQVPARTICTVDLYQNNLVVS
jgi:hypothetical protein